MTTVYSTVQGRSQDTTEAIDESDALLGAESSKDWLDGYTPKFLDYPFTDPDATVQDHIEVVREVEPRLTVAPDIEKGRTLTEAVRFGDELLTYADDVILVPKSVRPERIPDRFRVGMSVGGFGTQASWSVWRYRGCDSVHILGGTPIQQLRIGQHLDNITSVDCESIGKDATYGVWTADGRDTDSEGCDYKQRLKMSLNNYAAAWSTENRTSLSEVTADD